MFAKALIVVSCCLLAVSSASAGVIGLGHPGWVPGGHVALAPAAVVVKPAVLPAPVVYKTVAAPALVPAAAAYGYGYSYGLAHHAPLVAKHVHAW